MDLLSFKVGMVPSPSGDVKTRQLSISVNGGSTMLQDVAVDATEAKIEVPEGATVVLQEVVTDDAGNSAVGEKLTFTAVDTIAPTIGGPLTVSEAVCERTVADPTKKH